MGDLQNKLKQNPIGYLIGFLLIFVVAWTFFNSISRPGLDSNGDMVENFAWGQEWQLGYFKHPPLFAWTSAAWFKIFPRQEWLYSLLSYLNVAATLGAIYALARIIFPPPYALVAVVLFAFVPTFTFLSEKYNANTAQMPWWVLTTLFFLYGVSGKHWLYGILLGVSAALAVLSKYYSLVLLAALFFSSLHVAKSYYRTPHPYLALTAFAVVMAPHIVWIFGHDFTTVRYIEKQGGDWGEVFYRALMRFPLAQLAYLLVPILILWVMLRPTRQRMETNAEYITREHPWLWWLNPGLLFITAFAALMTKTALSSVWGIPDGFAFTLLLLVLFKPTEDHNARWLSLPKGIYTAAVVFVVTVALLGPLFGRLGAERIKRHAATPYAKIDAWIAAEWAKHTDRPLEYVGGGAVANGVTFYTWEHRSAVYFPIVNSPWVTEDDLRKQGMVVVCETSDARCQRDYENTRPFAPDLELAVSIQPDDFWGREMPRFDGTAWFHFPRAQP